MCWALADVFTAVDLGVKPAYLTRRDLNVTRIAGLSNQTALERRKCVHDAVGMLVRLGSLPRLVAILEDPHPLVLENDLVLVWIGAPRISHLHLPSSRMAPRHASRANRHPAGRRLCAPSAEDVGQPT